MFERFTDRTRKVFQLANQISQSFNTEYISTNHLLLGMIREGSGVAIQILKNLEVNLDLLKTLIESITARHLDIVSLGKLPQSPDTKTVIKHAIRIAEELKSGYIGTEHLLLGILYFDNPTCRVLVNINIDYFRVYDTLTKIYSYIGKPADKLREENTPQASYSWTFTLPLDDSTHLEASGSPPETRSEVKEGEGPAGIPVGDSKIDFWNPPNVVHFWKNIEIINKLIKKIDWNAFRELVEILTKEKESK